MVKLLEEIAAAVRMASDVVRELLKSPGTDHNPYVIRLLILLEELYQKSEAAAMEINLQASNKSLKDSLSVMYRDGEEIEEMYKMLKRTIPSITPLSLILQLEADVKKIKDLLTTLVPYVVGIFGSREALFIVTPGFQHRAGLW
jgi:hypothetical protein